jgi:hypothetical protein
MGLHNKIRIVIIAVLLTISGLTCNNNNPTEPWEEPFDPYRPKIDGFAASRAGSALTDGICFSGEDIDLAVQATSKAFPVSCGLDEGDVLQGNLIYYFSAVPPQGFNAQGLFSQATPPSNEALWRVPNVADIDTGEGVVYTLKVIVYDQCLASQNTGSITLRVFADQGPPLISTTVVESAVNTGSPEAEEVDKNGLYEVERGDKCRISITAINRSYESICGNRGIKENEELLYAWDSNLADIGLTCDEFPARASIAQFDVPSILMIGHTWSVTCLVTDACTGTTTLVTCRFIIVGAPRITGIDCTVNGQPLIMNAFFDTFEVQPGDGVIVTADGLVMDDQLCDSKGISPDLLWHWEETNGATPAINPVYNPLPVPNDSSRFEFVIPAASNGTEYRFLCTLTDRCNELTDTETASFTVIVPPDIDLTYVQRSSVELEPSIETGKYHVSPGDHMVIRVTATSASSAGFCTARGVSLDPPLQYYFELPWDDMPVLNYDAFPSVGYCDLEFIVPWYAPALDANLRCRVRDLCNELGTEIIIPFRVVQ